MWCSNEVDSNLIIILQLAELTYNFKSMRSWSAFEIFSVLSSLNSSEISSSSVTFPVGDIPWTCFKWYAKLLVLRFFVLTEGQRQPAILHLAHLVDLFGSNFSLSSMKYSQTQDLFFLSFEMRRLFIKSPICAMVTRGPIFAKLGGYYPDVLVYFI